MKVGRVHRPRPIQDLMQTAGPMIGVAATAIGSAYTGLKGLVVKESGREPIEEQIRRHVRFAPGQNIHD